MYHEHVLQDETEEMLEDKIFFVVRGTNLTGTLLESFEGGRNEWMTFEAAFRKEKKFVSFKKELDILDSESWLVEQTVRYSKDKF